MSLPRDIPTLLDWRRRIFSLYAEIRSSDDGRESWRRWCAVRDDLFAGHPQSPIPPGARGSFTNLDYYDYDPGFRVLASIRSTDPEHYEIATSGQTTLGFTRFGVASFELDEPLDLELYWLDGYAGGLFLSYRDATSGSGTYGAGRYLFDTIKGADLGMTGDRLVLDFNFSYNPSCAYDARWVCPLATPANRLDVAIRAGEKAPR